MASKSISVPGAAACHLPFRQPGLLLRPLMVHGAAGLEFTVDLNRISEVLSEPGKRTQDRKSAPSVVSGFLTHFSWLEMLFLQSPETQTRNRSVERGTRNWGVENHKAKAEEQS